MPRGYVLAAKYSGAPVIGFLIAKRSDAISTVSPQVWHHPTQGEYAGCADRPARAQCHMHGIALMHYVRLLDAFAPP